MKVYLIENSNGSYDDYYTYIKTGFLDKEKAQEYVDKYNKDLDDKVRKSDECYDCSCGKYDYLSKVLRNCKLGARKSDIGDIKNIDGDLYFECNKNVYDCFIDDEHKSEIKEIEIIE